uniref:hypothetical protein n=1 Tax=Shewanella gaetbuli TaxID=220752 RepID=UPI003B5A9286
MSREFTENQKELVTYGFEKIDPEEKVEVNLKDLMFVYRTLQEYMRFLHQPMHYTDMDDIKRFLGTAQSDAGFKVLNEALYEKMRDMIPEHIDDLFGEGIFDNPKLPFYYNENRKA